MTAEEVTSLRPWQYSVKLEVNAKGYVQPSVHVYGDNLNLVTAEAQDILVKIVTAVKTLGFRVATDMPAEDKEVKPKK